MRRFPKDFALGVSTASYQIEGAWREDGKGASIWDAFCLVPGRIEDGATGETACDHYHRAAEDVALMKRLGIRHYRFSLAWPRIQPSGSGAPNAAGLAFYGRLIDLLLDDGIRPWVTIYHWDLPLALQVEKDGWLNADIAERYAEYAAICFKAFGDRVKNWTTFNEPWVSSVHGYGTGRHAPGRKSADEPYLAGHNILRSHARAVALYRREFKPAQGGVIGITFNSDWREPRTQEPQDVAAAERSLEFHLGWFADPVYLGDYPAVMKEWLGSRLPELEPREKAMLRGSSDFFGINHYRTQYAAQAAGTGSQLGTFWDDHLVELSQDPAWPRNDTGNVVPWGVTKLLRWIDTRYSRPLIIMTENGCSLPEPTYEAAREDKGRIECISSCLGGCLDAVDAGVNLGGYFAWSLMDNFEWAFGYTKRFGLVYVDYASQRRLPKKSAEWFAGVAAAGGL